MATQSAHQIQLTVSNLKEFHGAGLELVSPDGECIAVVTPALFDNDPDALLMDKIDAAQQSLSCLSLMFGQFPQEIQIAPPALMGLSNILDGIIRDLNLPSV